MESGIFRLIFLKIMEYNITHQQFFFLYRDVNSLRIMSNCYVNFLKILRYKRYTHILYEEISSAMVVHIIFIDYLIHYQMIY